MYSLAIQNSSKLLSAKFIVIKSSHHETFRKAVSSSDPALL